MSLSKVLVWVLSTYTGQLTVTCHSSSGNPLLLSFKDTHTPGHPPPPNTYIHIRFKKFKLNLFKNWGWRCSSESACLVYRKPWVLHSPDLVADSWNSSSLGSRRQEDWKFKVISDYGLRPAWAIWDQSEKQTDRYHQNKASKQTKQVVTLSTSNN